MTRGADRPARPALRQRHVLLRRSRRCRTCPGCRASAWWPSRTRTRRAPGCGSPPRRHGAGRRQPGRVVRRAGHDDLVPITADVPGRDGGGHRHLRDRRLDGADLAGRAAGRRAGGRAGRQRGGRPGGRVASPGTSAPAGWSPSCRRRPPGRGPASGRARRGRAGPGARSGATLTDRLVAAAGGPVDVVIDPVFGEPAAAAALALGPGGRLVNLGGAAGDAAEFSSAALRGRSLEHPRLHQQRDLRRAAGRGPDLGAGPGRPRRGGRRPPRTPAGRV